MKTVKDGRFVEGFEGKIIRGAAAVLYHPFNLWVFSAHMYCSQLR